MLTRSSKLEMLNRHGKQNVNFFISSIVSLMGYGWTLVYHDSVWLDP